MPEFFDKFERQYSYKLYLYKKKLFYSCLKLTKDILKNISSLNIFKFKKQLLNVFSTVLGQLPPRKIAPQPQF